MKNTDFDYRPVYEKMYAILNTINRLLIETDALHGIIERQQKIPLATKKRAKKSNKARGKNERNN